MTTGVNRNRLAAETSPYLQQHATNPVDWHPWGDEALGTARKSDRPILLSVGYSACHWCHVMAHECFENEETAALMNRHFVNIKVDREERPDIDQIYQTAHQLIAQGAGGWPLTMFLTPDGKPFYGGTYFPKRPRYGRPGFDQLLARIAELWTNDRADLLKNGDAVVQALGTTIPRRAAGAMSSDSNAAGDTIDEATNDIGRALIEQMMRSFDARNGGFGRAPKFPQPSVLSALLREAVVEKDNAARDAVVFTLRRMAEGGLYDHLGGGFCRYSTDERWLIPHFEKMLYDNGPLLRLYAEAWQLTRDPFFREVCEGTATWMMREMQSPDDTNGGGYYSSLDADSEGEEGKFYIWTREEIAARLDADEFAALESRYGLDGPPNFEDTGAGMQRFGATLARPAWHLHIARTLPEVAAALGRDTVEIESTLARARGKLAAVRESRVRPGRDDKILASWNALAIDGMLFAARVFGRDDWAASARRALGFVRSTLWKDGRLLATYKDGRAHLNAYLDDHAYLLAALIESMQHGALRAEDVEWATSIAGLLLAQFDDPEEGGFFFTSHDHETLVLRPKPGYDNATPSGNGSAALHLQRFAHLVGDLRYGDAAERAIALFAGQASRVPQAFATLVQAMRERADPPSFVVITESATNAGREWQRSLATTYAPGVIVVRVAESGGAEALPQTLRKPMAAGTQAWICKGSQCLPPIADMRVLQASL